MSASTIRKTSDWIQSFLNYTAAIPSPRIFREWTAVATIAGAMERKTWVSLAGSAVYPNMYTLLVSPPGVGKTKAIEVAKDLWTRLSGVCVAPDSVTKASLIDALEDAKRIVLLSPTQMVEFHALLVSASEFGVLVPAHDLEFLSTVNHLYDNPTRHEEKRRTTKRETQIPFPQLNILAGTQPAYLANLLPETAWGMGFTSRLILVYASERMVVDLFDQSELNQALRDDLVADLEAISGAYGGFQFTGEAKDAIEAWNRAGCPPHPDHSKLASYASRRLIHCMKMTMVMCMSRGQDMLITAGDFNRALKLLLEAEEIMPEIFRAMVFRSDIDILQDLHFYLWQMYSKHKQAIHLSVVVSFLHTKVPAERIAKIIEVAVSGNLLSKQADDLFVPVSKTLSTVGD